MSRRGQDSARAGGVKSLTFTGIQSGDRPPVLQPESAIEPARFEVQSYERWTAGSNLPVQVFGAFDLPQDFSSYVDRARSDIADRCLARAGRFLADMTHVVREYRADVDGQWRSESLREMTTLKEQRTVAEQRASDAEKKGKELTLELENLRADNEKATATLKQLTDDLGREKAASEEMRREGEEMSNNHSNDHAACCYPLSDQSYWHPGDDLSIFSQSGCRGFSSWVVVPYNNTTNTSNYVHAARKRGVKLEWAFPTTANSSILVNSSHKGAVSSTFCAPNAYIVNANTITSGIRCKCEDGFTGDGH
ncbi:hypothetical protein POM88_051373 [Heracleum sosnowskyi]|uniref:Uncharacterized protein n=1 Tax=Heracleum sosnowskyi TaxID=360622 RepID=A0AAD8GZD9_9APIA|nr:hypothetical protein POM88_051373 [Heracleum sosnowskyi]